MMNLKKRSQSGFTLAELLIVVAIIANLVAIGIPIFTKQLENARNRTDAYNARVIEHAVKIYYMSHPDEMYNLKTACDASGGLHCVQIIVDQDYLYVNPLLVPALQEANILGKRASTSSPRYLGFQCKSKVNWTEYSIAFTTYSLADDTMISSFRGRKGDFSLHSWEFYTSADATPFQNMALGKE